MIGLPTFRDVIRRNQVSSASSALSADLAYARTEAITRGTTVSICPSAADGMSCMNSDLGSSYASGWLVYTYTPGATVPGAAFIRGSAGSIVLRQNAGSRGVSIQATDAKAIGFDRLGQFKTSDNSTSGRNPPSFLICSTGGVADGGVGASSASVPGSFLVLDASGSVGHTAIASGGSCGT
jgi:type IV fimbrial biogenesis protein FimT